MPLGGLPTEIWCSIFEAAVSSVNHGCESEIGLDPDTLCALPKLKPAFCQSLRLSQVCKRWRSITTGLSGLWTRVYIADGAMEDTDMLDEMLCRSGTHQFHLDLHPNPDTFPPDTHAQTTNVVYRLLSQHLMRCRTLRISANKYFISFILDFFLDLHLSTGTTIPGLISPLSHLHIIGPSKEQDHPIPFFPPDLSVSTPALTSLRVDSFPIATYPRWALRLVSIVNASLTYRNYHHILESTPAQGLMLDGVTIPSGGPFIGGLVTPRPSSVISLILSKPRCLATGEASMYQYANFFTLTFVCCLEGLEFIKLDEDAMKGLVYALDLNPPIHYLDLRRLALRSMKVGQSEVLVLAKSFTHIDELVLQDVDEGTSEAVCEVWRSSGNNYWPLLSRISINGQVIGR